MYKIPFTKSVYVLTIKAWIGECIFLIARKIGVHKKPF